MPSNMDAATAANGGARPDRTSLADHGIHLRRETPGTHRAACPACAKNKRDDALSVTIKADGSAVWLCHRCAFKGALRPHAQGGGLRIYKIFRGKPMNNGAVHPKPPEAEQEHQYPVLAGPWRAFWRHECLPIADDGSPAAAYLRARGCALPHPEGDLRWCPEVRHPGGHVGPALVALVTDAVTADPLNLHRTWIKPDGSGKAAIDRPRLLLKNHRKLGGVIRLWPDAEVTYGLCIAEGIETALSAARGFGLAWATIDARNMEVLPALPGIEALSIIADHDRPNPKTGKRTGLAAAKECARRWAEAGCEVRIWRAPAEGADFNDWAQQGDAA
jgi:hypothetical protein